MCKLDIGVGIVGVGKCLPKNIVTTEAVAKRLGVTPQWILERTGIETRYCVRDGETASGMSAQAAELALKRADVEAKDINLIIGCTFSGDYIFPALACKIGQLIGATKAGSFDLLANCTGFQIGISIARDRLICDPTLQHILVIGAAVQSPYLNWNDPETSMFFGDGAAAAVVSAVPKGYGILASEIFSNTGVYDAVRLRGGGSSFPLRRDNVDEGLQYYEMSGLETWKQLIQHQPIVIRRALEKAAMNVNNVDLFILHQANLKLIQYLIRKMKLPLSKTHTTVEKFGNTADASIPITLCDAFEQGLIERGTHLVISGVGAGYIFGATVIRWY